MSDIVPVGFDYSRLSVEKRQPAKEAAFRISMHGQQVFDHYIAIGHELMAMKDLLGHGCFLEWIGAEFTMKNRMANYYMQFARRFGPNSQSFANLPRLAIPALAAIASAPEEIGDQVIEQIETGEVGPTTAAVKEAIAQAKVEAEAEAQAKIALAERAVADARASAEDYRRKAAEADQRATTAHQQLTLFQTEQEQRKQEYEGIQQQAASLRRTIEAMKTEIESAHKEAEQSKTALSPAAKQRISEVEAERETLKKDLERVAAHARQMEAEARVHRDEATRLAEEQHLRQAWRATIGELIGALRQGLGLLPTKADTDVFDPSDWQRLAEARTYTARLLAELDHLNDSTIIDVAST